MICTSRQDIQIIITVRKKFPPIRRANVEGSGPIRCCVLNPVHCGGGVDWVFWKVHIL